MKYLSLFSGIEAASVAWENFGWTCVGVSEVENFPCELLNQRYPNVPNLGDITKITAEKLNELGKIDIVVGGSPCQSFSVAGNREGTDDPRGQLMFDYIRVVNTVKPKWFVWENVPGVLSSNKGRDFGTLLREMADIGYDLCWRVLDAKNFGVPQKRRRVFLVGHLGKNRSPAEVLFERKGRDRDLEKSRSSREEDSRETEAGVGNSSDYYSLQGNLVGRVKGGPNGLGVRTNGPMYTLTNNDVHCVAFRISSHHSGGMMGNNPLVGYKEVQQSNTLDTLGASPAKNQGGIAIVDPDYYEHHPNDSRTKGPLSTANTVAARYGTGGGNTPIVVEGVKPIIAPLDCNGPDKLDGQWASTGQQVIENSTTTRVRRLTPLECERLQGFPDGWTNIEWKRWNKVVDTPASPRYKALGNSMAVPVMEWIGRGIMEQENDER